MGWQTSWDQSRFGRKNTSKSRRFFKYQFLSTELQVISPSRAQKNEEEGGQTKGSQAQGGQAPPQVLRGTNALRRSGLLLAGAVRCGAACAVCMKIFIASSNI